jgi:hypothetical protein
MNFDRIRLAGLYSVDLIKSPDQWDNNYILKGADGLGPSEMDVTIANLPNQGGYFQNKVPQNKQIIVRIGLNPFWSAPGVTASYLRENLYGLLTGGYTGDRIAVILMSDATTEVCRIYGYVSKFEIVPFSKDPQVQITIECLSPYFQAFEATGPVLGSLSTSVPSVNNVGTAPTGFDLGITFSGLAAPISYWQLTSQGGLHNIRITPTTPFDNGDSLEFSTVAGNRYITVTQDAVAANGLEFMSGEWLQLYGGNNIFNTSDSHFTWDVFEFVPLYQGV